MNKTLRNLALVALVAAPFSAFAEIAGSGTAEDPYQIATPQDLQNAYLKVNANISGTTYFVQTADIDMAEVADALTGLHDYHAIAGGAGVYTAGVHYDGRNHVIKNFAPKVEAENAGDNNYYKSVFGVIAGSIKNLGVIDANVDITGQASYLGTGILGAYAGNGSAPATENTLTTIDNVYVTGTIKGGVAAYTGGMFGTNGTDVTFNNCFADVQVTGVADYTAGLIGRPEAKTITFNNVYVAGTVGENNALVTGKNRANKNAATIVVNGMVVFNTGSTTTCATTATGTITMANTTATKDAGIAAVKTWPAFSKLENVGEYPALNYVLSGEGKKEKPYIIDCVEALCAMWTYTSTHNSSVYYFEQTADIDMEGVEVWHAALGNDGNYENIATIHYDGKNHVIKNFAPTNNAPEIVAQPGDYNYYAGSIFGVFTGTIENLGVENAYVAASKTLGFGVLGAYGSYCGTSKVNNVYVKGSTVDGYINYGAGMFGTMAANAEMSVTITNCYVDAEITGADEEAGKGYIGAFMGRVDGPVYMENCYAAGTVANIEHAGLIVGADRGKATAKADLLNVIAFNTGAAKAVACPLNEGSEDATIATDDNKYALIAGIIKGWTGFNEGKLNANGLPAFNWQTEGVSGIVDAVVVNEAEANGPAVYYNLQGVRVANPENGIYIVRRGNKVTKELVK